MLRESIPIGKTMLPGHDQLPIIQREISRFDGLVVGACKSRMKKAELVDYVLGTILLDGHQAACTVTVPLQVSFVGPGPADACLRIHVRLESGPACKPLFPS